jgi:hypothetical protein
MCSRLLSLFLSLAAAAAASLTPSAALDPPEAVEAAAIGETRVRVFWNPVAGAERYRIYREDALIGEVGAQTKEFTDQNAEPGRAYRYNVSALAGGREAKGRPYLERAFPVLPEAVHCEVLVVGANSAGVSAAVTASRYGLKVVLIEETRRLGGMAVNGLGASDIRSIRHSSGFFEEFRRRVQSLYGAGDGLRYEPRVAQQAIKEILWSAPGLTVYRQVRPIRVKVERGKITAVTAEEVTAGRRVVFYPKLVVDATECGDVGAWAGAPFRVGREPRSEREPHAGHIYYDRASDSRMPGSTGRGDRRVQAYSYLMIVKDFGPDADKTIPMPPGYDRNKYKGAPRWRDSWAVSSGRLPNQKFEINQHPHGSDLQGTNYAYPTASYAERRRMEREFKEHALGYLYYIQTENGMKNIGLSEDDYRDSDGWPTLLYIREARRFEGERMKDQSDIMRAREFVRPNAIGVGDYAMDSHATQPAPDFDHYARGPKHMGEGEFYLPQYTPWHQVPFEIMIPKGVDNLFTPTAVSATHVAYGTYRMEPVRMHFGAAAGVASYFCLRYGRAPRTVPVRQIQEELLKSQAGIEGRLAQPGAGAPGPCGAPTYLYLYDDLPFGAPRFEAIHWLGARGFYPCPPPERRTPSSGLTAARFEPDAPLSRGEADRLLAWLAKRGRAAGQTMETEAAGTNPQEPVTRAEAARLLARAMGWRAPAGADHYADLEPGSAESAAAEALYAQAITSRLWDFERSFAPNGRLYFRPKTPVTRGEFAELLFLACRHIGPLWNDHPLDLAPIPVTPVSGAETQER